MSCPRGILVALFGLAVLLPNKAPLAMVVNAQLNQVNNGTIITDPSEIIDVTADDGLGPAWRVTVSNGLNFEEFFFNYDQPLQSGDVMFTGSSTGQWTPDSNGGTAGNFGQFSFEWDGPVADGLPELTFDILAAGNFVTNAKGSIFAAKIASEQGGNAGGFVSTSRVSPVPLPAAGWMLLSALISLVAFARIRRSPAHPG